MKIAILGNGPTLKLPISLYNSYDIVILTNRLLWEELGNINTNILYVCADLRFSQSKLWLKKLQDFKFRIVLSDALFELIGENHRFSHINKFNDFPHKDLTNLIMVATSGIPDLLSNVVLDLAIPLALDQNAYEINLYGCAFDYGLTESIKKPAYYANYKTFDTTFDHSLESSRAWSQASQERFLSFKQILGDSGISLRNIK